MSSPTLRALLQPRPLNGWMLALCAALLAGAYLLEYGFGLEPCSLCILQRIALFGCALFAAVPLVLNPARPLRRACAAGVLVCADVGALLAFRQLWLQQLPPEQVPACMPSLDYLVEVMPLMDALMLALRGDGNCAEVAWRFLGLTLPGWAAVGFLGLITLSLVQLVRR
ncbi:MAG: disulfide bond formation protein B [Pseudomonadota bacterium]|nr:disulfide bond formation protein B [Pseudomonadota bacterium]